MRIFAFIIVSVLLLGEELWTRFHLLVLRRRSNLRHIKSPIKNGYLYTTRVAPTYRNRNKRKTKMGWSKTWGTVQPFTIKAIEPPLPPPRPAPPHIDKVDADNILLGYISLYYCSCCLNYCILLHQSLSKRSTPYGSINLITRRSELSASRLCRHFGGFFECLLMILLNLKRRRPSNVSNAAWSCNKISLLTIYTM